MIEHNNIMSSENETDKDGNKDIKSIKEFGNLSVSKPNERIQIISIIGQVEGHNILGPQTKATKYEHIIPQLIEIEQNDNVKGILIVLNTVGGDVEAGLAIAEMIASISKPTVTLVLGGSHSIGVPIAVSGDYSFIVPTGTMVIHPVRTNGMVIGVSQTFEYFKQIQDRILSFVCSHCDIPKTRLEELMLETEFLTKDVGSVLVGKQAVKEGIINEVGGIKEAYDKLKQLVLKSRK